MQQTRSISGHSPLEPTSCRFEAGDRIRLEIASSAFPLSTATPRAVFLHLWQPHGTGASPHSSFTTASSEPSVLVLSGNRDGEMSESSSVLQIEFNGVSKHYGSGRPILDSIDLAVQKLEFVTLIGPSGCGKSTILKLVSGLTPPSAGVIRIDGMTPENARETISFIFQDATLLPWRTVRKNVGLGLELNNIMAGRRENKVTGMLELVGLAHVSMPTRGNFPAG